METNFHEKLHFDRRINIVPDHILPRSFPMHWHNYVEFMVSTVSSDSTEYPTFCINDKTYKLHSKDILIIWPGELHEIKSCGKEQAICIQFPHSFFQEYEDFTPYIPLFREIQHMKYADNPQLSEKLFDILLKIKRIHFSKEDFSGVKEMMLLCHFFMELGLELKHTHNIHLEKDSSSMTGQISNICHYISEHCEDDLDLNTMAELTGFSPYYFSRKFKMLTQETFIEYLTKQRIKKAQLLLSDLSLPMTEVASQSGFQSISTFNRVFLKYKNCPPSEYRQYYSKD